MGHGGELIARARNEDRASANDAVEEPFLAVLVRTVTPQVLRTERAIFNGSVFKCASTKAWPLVSLTASPSTCGGHGVGFSRCPRWTRTGIGTRRGDGQSRRNRTDGVHVLAVIVHDDVKLGARVLGRHFVRVGPHRLHPIDRISSNSVNGVLAIFFVILGADDFIDVGPRRANVFASQKPSSRDRHRSC